jgi:hypothetical protein
MNEEESYCDYNKYKILWLFVKPTKLLNQGFLVVKLKSSLRKGYGRHHDLVNRYGIFVSQMTTDMFHIRKHFPASLSISRCRAMNEADFAVSLVSFI